MNLVYTFEDVDAFDLLWVVNVIWKRKKALTINPIIVFSYTMEGALKKAFSISKEMERGTGKRKLLKKSSGALLISGDHRRWITAPPQATVFHEPFPMLRLTETRA